MIMKSHNNSCCKNTKESATANIPMYKFPDFTRNCLTCGNRTLDSKYFCTQASTLRHLACVNNDYADWVSEEIVPLNIELDEYEEQLPIESELAGIHLASENKVSSNTGTKYDAGKLRLDLIHPEVIEALGKVYTYGATKYGDRNWENGLDEDRLIAASRRHQLAYAKGEQLDQESGLPHLAQAAWCLLTIHALQEMQKNKSA